MGPSALRVAGVDERLRQLGHEVEDRGDLPVKIPETQSPGDPRLKYLGEIMEVVSGLRDTVDRVLEGGATPVILGGRPLRRDGNDRRPRPTLPPPEAKDRARVVRCPRRCQHSRDLAERKHPRHAAGGRPRPRRAEPRQPRGLLSDGRRRPCRAGRHSGRGPGGAGQRQGLRDRGLHDARHRRAGHADRDGAGHQAGHRRHRRLPRELRPGRHGSRARPRGGDPRSGRAVPTGRPIWPWRCWPTQGRSSLPSSSR